MYESTVFVAATAILVLASVQDIRRREVSDWCWIALLALAVLDCLMTAEWIEAEMRVTAVILLGMFMFSPRVTGLVSVVTVSSAVALLIAVYLITSDLSTVVSALMAVSAIVMYATGMIRGGADAKALISLSLLYPMYPGFGCMLWPAVYPADLVFNPVFSAAAMALVLSVVWTLCVVHRSGTSGGCPVGQYVMDIDDARRAFVWPAEDIIDGRRARVSVTDDAQRIYDCLKQHGFKKVRVTPMIPFIPMLAIGLVASVMLGTPLNLLIS